MADTQRARQIDRARHMHTTPGFTSAFPTDTLAPTHNAHTHPSKHPHTASHTHAVTFTGAGTPGGTPAGALSTSTSMYRQARPKNTGQSTTPHATPTRSARRMMTARQAKRSCGERREGEPYALVKPEREDVGIGAAHCADVPNDTAARQRQAGVSVQEKWRGWWKE